MANIQHIYGGVGNPNQNPALLLTGDAVGNHLYQDSENPQSVWLSTFYEDEGNLYHEEWVRLLIEPDLSMAQVAVNQPQFEGQMGYSVADGTLFIAMWDPDSDFTLRWRATGMALGDWYTP